MSKFFALHELLTTTPLWFGVGYLFGVAMRPVRVELALSRRAKAIQSGRQWNASAYAWGSLQSSRKLIHYAVPIGPIAFLWNTSTQELDTSVEVEGSHTWNSADTSVFASNIPQHCQEVPIVRKERF